MSSESLHAPRERLSKETIAALTEALIDEYKARATYRKVTERFGTIRPFINIVDAEDRHASMLLSQFRRFDLIPPTDDWNERVVVPSSIKAACSDAVEAEIENDTMYERLLSNVDDPEIQQIFRRLQSASRDNHLPAFRRCLERETRRGRSA